MPRTLLALHAHPDDESSKGGGTVARYSDAGVRTVLVTATAGEAGDILNPAADSGEARRDIGAVRRRELFEAAEVLGFDDVIMLGYRDSGMPDTPPNSHPDAFVNADIDEVLKRLVAIIRSERPQVMLGYDDHEWYPHPDHLRVHELSVPVFEAAADPERYPDAGEPWEIAKLYAPTFSRSRLEILHAAMKERGLSSPYGEWLERLPPLDEDEAVDARVDVGAYIGRARTALAAHRTQIDPDGPWFQVPTDLLREVYPYEDFQLLATRVEQAPGGGDLFEGVGE